MMKNLEISKKKPKRKLSLTKCKICGQVFSYSYLLPDHMKRKHLKQKDFKCTFCPLSFVHSYELKRHYYVHTGEKPHKCQFCKKSFSRRTTKGWHEDTHKVLKHTCKFCDKVFYYRYEKNVHEKRMHTNKVLDEFQCVECRKRFSTKEYLQSHMQEHNINIKCSYCPQMFSKYLECKLHEKEHKTENHPPSKMHKRVQRKQSSLLNISSSKIDGSYYYECHMCNESFIMRQLLLKHYEVTHPGKRELLLKFPCGKCNKRFMTYQGLYQHKAVHAIEKSHKCVDCDYKTARKKDLKVHITNCHSLPSFKCEYCGKVFKRKRVLQAHVNVHENRKDFKCDECNKSYFSLSSLHTHKLNHLKHLVCSICGMVCNFTSIRHHVSLHSKDMNDFNIKKQNHYLDFYEECPEAVPLKSFEVDECKLCTKQLTSRSEFQAHINCHGEDLLTYQTVNSSFECYACGLIFPSFKELESHDESHVFKLFVNFICRPSLS